MSPIIAVYGTSVWFGGYSGASHFNSGVSTWNVYNTDNGLSDNFVGRIAVESGGAAWFGTYVGADRFDNASWTSYNGRQWSCRGQCSFALHRWKENTKWFGSWHSGVTKFDGFSWTIYNIENSGIINNGVNAIASGPDGSMWFATNGGVSRLSYASDIDQPAPPSDVTVEDVPDDHGHSLEVSWTLSAG